MIVIAFEGPDQVGKTTQSNMLLERLKLCGLKAKRVKVPINDVVLFRLIYWMLGNSLAKKFPMLFQFLQFKNKFLWQLFVKPFLSLKYDILVLDRWAPSSVVYGSAEGLPKGYVMFLYNRLFKPDATVVFHGVTRKRKGMEEDSYEKDSKLQIAVRNAYVDWANTHVQTVLIDNTGEKQEVHERIMNKLGPHGLNVLRRNK